MSAIDSPVELYLHDAEVEKAQALAMRLAEAGADPTEPGFYDRSWPLVEQLPVRLRRFLEDFRRTEPAAACLVHGFATDDAVDWPDAPTLGRSAGRAAGPDPRHLPRPVRPGAG